MVPFQNVYNGKSLQLLNLGKNPIQIKWSKLHLKPDKCNRKISQIENQNRDPIKNYFDKHLELGY